MQETTKDSLSKERKKALYKRYYPWAFILISYAISFLHLYVRKQFEDPSTDQLIVIGVGFGFIIVPLMAWSIRSPIRGVKRKIKAHKSKLRFFTSGLVTILLIFLLGSVSAIPAMVLDQLGYTLSGVVASLLMPPCPIVFLPVVIGFANNDPNSNLFEGFNSTLTLIGYDVEVTGPEGK